MNQYVYNYSGVELIYQMAHGSRLLLLSEMLRLMVEFDETTQLLRVYGDAASFPVLIQRWSVSWANRSKAVLHLGKQFTFLMFLHLDERAIMQSAMFIVNGSKERKGNSQPKTAASTCCISLNAIWTTIVWGQHMHT